MDPYLGPVASALVAAVCAGTMLGLVRLSRVSLEWWRRRGAAGADSADAAALAAAADAVSEADDTFDAFRVREAREGAFREANFVLYAAALAGAVGVAIALDLATGTRSGLALPEAVPASLSALASATALAPLVLVTLVAAAFLLALADRGVTAVARRFGLSVDVSTLDTARWVEAARLLWPGGDAATRRREPFGVGLAYVALFAASAAAWGALLIAFRNGSAPPVLLLGPLLLIVPLSYAAAAERSQRNALARLRQAAAGRQLTVAPAWGMAIAATLPAAGVAGVAGVAGIAAAAAAAPPIAATAWAVLAVVLATPLALPGTAVGSAWANWPRGGDAEEPSVGVRALSAVAHYAWLGAIALAVGLRFVSRAGGASPTSPASPWSSASSVAAALGVASAIALAVLVVRTLAARADERSRRVIGAVALAAGAIALVLRGGWAAP